MHIHLNQIILLVGVSTLLIGLVQFFFSAEPKAIHVPYETAGDISAFGLRFAIARQSLSFASMAISISLYLFLHIFEHRKSDSGSFPITRCSPVDGY